MCGRFTITWEAEPLQAELELGEMPADWLPRYNAAPSQPIGVVTDPKSRRVEWMRWGLVPSWAKDISIGNKLINARAETLTEKPSFRNAFNRRRCLILADGFYEWQHTGDKRSPSTPYYFHRKDRKPFAFAGLWEFWKQPDGDPVLSTTIITTSANGMVGSIHDRMPVMLSGENLWAWLEPKTAEELHQLLKPYPEEWMGKYPVSRMVNDPGRDVNDLISPVVE